MGYPTTLVAGLDNGRVGGYIILWGDANNKDLQNEYFTPQTWLNIQQKQYPITYYGGTGGETGYLEVGTVEKLTIDDNGVFVEGHLDMSKHHVSNIYKLIEGEILHFCSLSNNEGVEIADDGQIIKWPLEGIHLTSTPVDPR